MVLDQSMLWSAIVDDVIERPYVSAGFASFLILLPLALTSNRAAIKRLGKRWKGLHRWVYIAAVFALLHYIWLAKGERLEPIVYLAVLLLLLSYRLVKLINTKSAN